MPPVMCLWQFALRLVVDVDGVVIDPSYQGSDAYRPGLVLVGAGGRILLVLGFVVKKTEETHYCAAFS